MANRQRGREEADKEVGVSRLTADVAGESAGGDKCRPFFQRSLTMRPENQGRHVVGGVRVHS